MKVTKITPGNITSHGITFEYNKEVEVSEEVSGYLLATFPTGFQFEESKTPKSTKPKGRDTSGDNEGTDRKRRSSKSSRTKKTS
jgi:hypothetical protein